MPQFFYFVLLLLVLSLVGIIVFLVWWFKPIKPEFSLIYTSDLPKAPFKHLTFVDPIPFNSQDPTFDGQSMGWQEAMQVCGRHFKSSRVRACFFIHGTFVGHDPLGLVAIAKTVYPKLNPATELMFRQLVKLGSDKLIKDSGNYLPGYIALYEKSLQTEIRCFPFHWSSENHHLGRLRAAMEFMRFLSEKSDALGVSSLDRLLVQGHSHGGQIFALLTTLLDKDHSSSRYVQHILERSGVDSGELDQCRERLRHVSFDFVTYGTPIRYPFLLSDKMSLLNIVNHRGEGHLGGTVNGLLTTRDGDYIQQYGIAGTDLIAVTAKDRELNRELDQVLGTGNDLRYWKEAIVHRMRVSPFGKTLLIDYGDRSLTVPNALNTFLGHGVYTRYDKMLFNTKLLVSEL